MKLRHQTCTALGSILVLLAIGALPAWGQIYHTVTYNDQAGLPSATIAGLAQDGDGYLWLATRSGLVRYDGLDWATEVGGDPLPDQPLGDLVRGPGGDLWAVSRRTPANLYRYESGRWQVHAISGSDWSEWDVHTLLVGPTVDGAPLVVTLSRRATIHLTRHGEAVRIDPGRELRWISAGLWRGRDLLLATDRGLVRVDGLPGAPTFERLDGLPPGPVYAIAEGLDGGDPVVVGADWVGRLAADGLTSRRDVRGLDLGSVDMGCAAVVDPGGAVHVGSINQLQRIDPDRIEAVSLSTENGLAGNGATDLLIDRAGPVWIASLRGLTKLIDRSLVGYDGDHGLLTDEVSAVLERRDGMMLLGHPGGMTVLTDPPRPIDFRSSHGRAARVSDLLETTDGIVWIAASRNGLGRMASDGEIVWLDGVRDVVGDAYALAADRTGTVHIGGSDGVARLIGDRLQPIELRSVDQARRLSIRRLGFTSDGALWAATGGHGLFRIAADGASQLVGTEHLLDSTYGILERADGRIWVATVDGLAHVVGDRIERTRAPAPVIERPIYALAEDRDGRIWIGTDVGVRLWDGRRLVTLDARGGLIGSETNRDALMVDRRGRVWIGTDRGVTRHDPALVEPVVDPPSVTITQIALAGEPVDLDEPLTIRAGVSDLTIEFRSLPFRDERRLRFRTFLEGLDAGWRPAARIPSQSVRYSHLPPGTYRFGVQAVGPRGDGGAIASTPVIDVTPPFWRSWWFRAMVALAAIVLMALSFQVMQGRRYARRLAREVASRTRELAASEQAVQRESRRLSTVLTSISDGVLAVRADGCIVLGNLAAADLVGCANDELIGQPLDRFFPDLSVTPEQPGDRLADPVFEYPFTTPGGHDLDLEVSIAPLAEDDADSSGWVLAFRDVTDRRRLEQESIRSQKLESLGVLAGGLAHDFNNLMTVVLGHLSVIEEGPSLSVGDRASLQRMRDATEQARGLTGQLLTFARGGEPRKQPTDLVDLARRTAELVTSGSSCGLDLDLPADLPVAEVDPGQLEQVFSNLLINARQAMPEGGVIRVRGRASMRGAEPRVEISIVDEGPGIAAEIVDRIFEPYFTTKDGGSGLGLSICYSVVHRHGGELRTSSPVAGGAEFTVSLPATRARLGDAPPTGSTTAVGGLRILVLDDEEPVRDIMTRMLEREGHACVAVATGEDAVAEHASALRDGRPYDVVVVDLTIADGMGGAEAFARIREREPDVRGVVASGYSHDPIMSHHEQHGFGAALRKPFDRASLAAAVATVMETAPSSGGDQ